MTQLLSSPDILSILKRAEKGDTEVSKRVWNLVKDLHKFLYADVKAGEKLLEAPRTDVMNLAFELFLVLGQSHKAFAFLDELQSRRLVII